MLAMFRNSSSSLSLADSHTMMTRMNTYEKMLPAAIHAQRARGISARNGLQLLHAGSSSNIFFCFGHN